jgi:hypothetical protein
MQKEKKFQWNTTNPIYKQKISILIQGSRWIKSVYSAVTT